MQYSLGYKLSSSILSVPFTGLATAAYDSNDDLIDEFYGENLPDNWAFDITSGSPIDIYRVEFYEGLKSIGNSAFESCFNLTSIEPPSTLKTIGYSSFYGTGISELILPVGFNAIGANAFNECYGLSLVSFPNTLLTIGDGAFALSGVQSLLIPSSVQYIGDSAFSECTSLTDVVIYSSAYINQFAFAYCASLLNLAFYSDTEIIGYSSFALDGNLQEVILPDSLIEINGFAFTGSGLLEVTIPENVTLVAEGSFSDSLSLTDGYFYINYNYIDSTAFLGSGLTNAFARSTDNTWTAGTGQDVGGATVTVTKNL
jgi:hypothetical protein